MDAYELQFIRNFVTNTCDESVIEANVSAMCAAFSEDSEYWRTHSMTSLFDSLNLKNI